MKSFLLRFFGRHTLYFVKVDLYFLLLRLRNAVSLRNPRRLKPAARYMNFGCGRFGIKGDEWLNVDGSTSPIVDYTCDLRRRLPFEDNRFEGIFTEHFFEHLHPEDARAFLRECLRMLKPGGVLRVSVPDGGLYLRNYVEDRDWLLRQLLSREHLDPKLPSQRTAMATVNEVFRQHAEHQFCYDFETLSLYLSEAGFVDIRRADFGAGICPALQIDKKTRRIESLYVEGRKP